MGKKRENNEISNIAKFYWYKWYSKKLESLNLKEAEETKYKGKFIRPYLNKDHIRNISREFKINNKTLEKIIPTIKLLPLIFTKEAWIEAEIKKEMSSLLNSLNQQIKKLSPLIKILENHQKQSPLPSILYYEADTSSIPPAIEELKFKIEVYREIIKFKQKNDKRFYLENFIIYENLKKSPQKYKMWNGIVSKTIKILNPYCHNDNCHDDACNKTHEKTYKIMAKLLKIIYPKIWKENINIIANRIKQKDYRQL